MNVKWTAEQKQVLDARNSTLLVSAAAGSGKTAVLSSRIVSLLTDKDHPLEIDRILVVTFTNAAAAEMRERIAREIEKALDMDPDNTHLKKQAALVHHARITTIDSFCLYVLRNYALQIELPGTLTVGDPGEMTLLASEAMDQVMQEAYEGKDADVEAFITAYRRTRSDEPVREMIARCAGFAESFPWPDKWLKNAGKIYEGGDEFINSPLTKACTDSVGKLLKSLGEELKSLVPLCLSPGGPEAYSTLLEQEGELLASVSGNYDELRNFALGFSFGRLPSKRDPEVDPDKKALIKGRRDKIKEKFNKIKDKYLKLSLEDAGLGMKKAEGHVMTLLALAQRYRELFLQKKRERNTVDFSDIEHFALKILVDPETGEPTDVARLFADMYDEIMVDEYQDSNLVQEEILKAISGMEKGEHHLFMVGDVKQSIYRFRQARPELFMEKYHRFQKEGTERLINLHKNFRSRSEVLSPVNRIFYRLMKEDLGHIEYTDEEALFPGAGYKETKNKIFFSFNLIEDNDTARTTLQADSSVALEERVIAKKIKDYMTDPDFEITDKDTGELRRCRFKDIAILLRSPGSAGPELIEELKKDGIPAVFSQTSGFFDSPEVANMLNYLRIIDNPRQDIPLAGSLLSPIGGFSEEELADIVAEEREKAKTETNEAEGASEPGFYDCVFNSPKTEAFRKQLDRYREFSAWMPVHELMEKICTETGYLQYEAALPGGEQREANIRMLIEKAAMYEEGRSLGLYRFIRIIENLRKYDADLGEAELSEENVDAVRILSIHKSKGLEFPVVILAGTGRKLNRADVQDRLLLSPDHGLGLLYIDGDMRTKESTFPRDAIAYLTEEEELGEELRVLYVALTRAKERLYITGAKKNLMAQWEGELFSEGGNGTKALSYGKRMSAGCYLDWLLAAAAPFEGSEEFNFDIISPENLVIEREGEEKDQAYSLLGLNEILDDTKPDPMLSKRMDFCYPYEGEESVRDKISVSELKKKMMSFEAEDSLFFPEEKERKKDSPIPSFAREKETYDPTLRGMAYHRLMECVDLTLIDELEGLSEKEKTGRVGDSIKALSDAGLISEEWADLIEPAVILRFLESETGRAMYKADQEGKLYREKPFVMGLPAGKLYGTESDETVIIQGIIDAFFYEGEKITILDYKTDRVKKAEELKDKYNIQLELYKEAVERMTQCKNIRKVLYSFTLNRIIDLD